MQASLFLAGAGGAAALARLRYSTRVTAPVAKRVPHLLSIGAAPGENRGPRPFSPPVTHSDDLFWLRDDERQAPDVLAHLTAENQFTALKTGALAPQIDALYAELLSRVKETDADVPYAWGAFSYYKRTVKGLAYPIHCRVPRAGADAASAAGAPGPAAALGQPLPNEQVLLDENKLAAGRKMCDVSCVQPSPDHTLLAYSVDFSGVETYAITVKRLLCGPGGEEPAIDVIEGTNGDIEWGADASTLFYLTMDEAHRPNKAWAHSLGRPQSEDVCLCTEDDEMFWMHFSKARSGEFLFIDSSSKTTSEVRALDLRAVDLRALQQREHVVPVDSTTLTSTVRVLAPRVEGVLYEADHYQGAGVSTSPSSSSGGGRHGDVFVITTNAGDAKNFKVVTAPVLSGVAAGGESDGAAAPSAAWRELLPHSPARKIDGVDVFGGFWAFYGREGGFQTIWVAQGADIDAFLASGSPPVSPGAACGVPLVQIPAREAVYVLAGLGGNKEYDGSTLRFTYSSPVSPTATCEFSAIAPSDATAAPQGEVAVPHAITTGAGITTGDWTASVRVLKQREVPNCDLAAYATCRLFAPAGDGTLIPISLVWRPSAVGGGSAAAAGAAGACPCPPPTPAPLLLYGYGSYGHSCDPFFSSSVLTLLDRGVVYAVAHVRGGGEMGRAWYEDHGKLMTKKNTFSDFIACAEHLIATGWADKGRVAAQGASAGGLLMGAVLVQRPELWRAILSQVGFVDVLVTMSDPSIPLTITEWEEWGNPNEAGAFEYIQSYSPMENIPAHACFPRTLLTAGLNDSRVAYWEVAKFAQRLRAAHTGPGDRILAKFDMGAGHFSWSDRYAHLRETAFEWAWLLDALAVPVELGGGGAGGAVPPAAAR